MARDLPDPMRPIRLERSTRVDVEPMKPRTLNDRVPSFDDVESRIGGAPFTLSERPAVAWLARRGVGLERVAEDGKTRTPDAVISAARATVELKRMDAASANSVRRLVRRGGRQSRHLVIDSRGTGLSAGDAREWLSTSIYGYGHYLDQVVVILEGRAVAPLEWRRV